jgi:hypothetical protein
MIYGKPEISDAIKSLRPNAEYILVENDYSKISWLSKDVVVPTETEILEELDRQQLEYDTREYQRLRANEYPPMADYLDGIVKNDQEQIQAYIDACQAVKDKYPKPSL